MTRCVMMRAIMRPFEQIPPPPSARAALAAYVPGFLAADADLRESTAVARYLTSRTFAEIADSACRRADAIARLEHSLRRVDADAA
jgi:hypothetical protein